MEKYCREEKRISSKRNVWDCGSTLYDSYELNSFKRQIGSAIANSPRTLSMPHLSIIQPHPAAPISNNNKISRTFHKLFRFIFKSNNNNKFRFRRSNSFRVAEKYSKDDHHRYYVVYDKSEPFLSTIPELPDFEIDSFVRKSASERFTATSIRTISSS